MTRLIAIALSLCLFSQDAMAAYGFYRTVTVDHTKCGSGNSSNFPMLLSTTLASLKTTGNGGNVTNVNGYDIVPMSDAAGTTKLDFEIEFYDGTAGTIYFWSRIPTMSASVDTVIYLYYGNSAITTSQENVNGTWNSNYKSVWHLKEPSGTLVDSTSNGSNAAVAFGSPTFQATGQIKYGMTFAQSSLQYLTTSKALSSFITASDGTLSCWVKPTGSFASPPQAYNTNGFLGDGSGYVGLYWRTLAGNQTITAFNWDGNEDDANATISTGAYHHAVMTHTGGNIRLYLDGSSSGPTASGDTQSLTGNFTAARAYTSGDYFNGSLDECRTLNTALSADWVTTEYNNISSTGTFYSIGAETPVATAATQNIRGASIQGGKANIQGGKVNIQ